MILYIAFLYKNYIYSSQNNDSNILYNTPALNNINTNSQIINNTVLQPLENPLVTQPMPSINQTNAFDTNTPLLNNTIQNFQQLPQQSFPPIIDNNSFIQTPLYTQQIMPVNQSLPLPFQHTTNMGISTTPILNQQFNQPFTQSLNQPLPQQQNIQFNNLLQPSMQQSNLIPVTTPSNSFNQTLQNTSFTNTTANTIQPTNTPAFPDSSINTNNNFNSFNQTPNNNQSNNSFQTNQNQQTSTNNTINNEPSKNDSMSLSNQSSFTSSLNNPSLREQIDTSHIQPQQNLYQNLIHQQYQQPTNNYYTSQPATITSYPQYNQTTQDIAQQKNTLTQINQNNQLDQHTKDKKTNNQSNNKNVSSQKEKENTSQSKLHTQDKTNNITNNKKHNKNEQKNTKEQQKNSHRDIIQKMLEEQNKILNKHTNNQIQNDINKQSQTIEI
jgi:hypothetical protein